MIRHIFMWQVATGSDPDEVIEILSTLKELPSIRGWELGKHQGDPGENGDPWDGALITDFESWDGLEAYSNDPYHQQVVDKLLPYFAVRAVVDFERASNR